PLCWELCRGAGAQLVAVGVHGPSVCRSGAQGCCPKLREKPLTLTLSRGERGLIQMTGDGVVRGDLFGHRGLVRTVRHGMRAARVKAAPGGGIEGARDLTGEGQPLPLLVGMRW